MDYIRRTSVGIHDEAEDVIKQTEEEYPDINPSVPVEVEKEDDPAEPGDNPQDFVDEGLDQPTATHPEIGRRGENPDAEYTRAIAFKAVQGDLEIETPHKFKQAEEAKERLSEIKQANEMLERSGHFRRYIPTDADAPDPAHIYEDEFGKYYYKAPDFNLRPSHVAEYTGKQAFPVLDDDEQIVKTVEFMVELSEDVMLDTMKSVEAADAWLERNMVLTDDEPGSKDTFSHGFKETVSFVVGGSGNSNKSVEKTPEGVPDNAVYLPPGEDPPEGAQTVESDHGAMYYIPPEESLSPEQEEAVDHFEDFLNDIDPSDVQDPRTDSDPEEREALEIWSEYTQGEIGEQEFAERTEEFIEDWAGETLE